MFKNESNLGYWDHVTRHVTLKKYLQDHVTRHVGPKRDRKRGKAY